MPTITTKSFREFRAMRAAISIIVMSATLVSVPAHAQYFGGLPLNAVKATLPEDVNNLLFRSRLFTSVEPMDNGGTDLKVGYRFSSHLVPHFSLVGQYADASRWGGPRMSFDGARAAQKTSSYGLDLVGTLPIFDRLSMTASAGLARVRADTVFGGAVPIGLLDSDGRYTSAGRVGLGVQYDFSRRLGFRFGVERYRNLNGNTYANGNLDADSFSVGMRIRF
ncbi:MAG: outer membrane beta-barrel protein [Burkholderiales bacterium]|nr:outer membrane beta-barrel protein [Burkholderiales bacterium]